MNFCADLEFGRTAEQRMRTSSNIWKGRTDHIYTTLDNNTTDIINVLLHDLAIAQLNPSEKRKSKDGRFHK